MFAFGFGRYASPTDGSISTKGHNTCASSCPVSRFETNYLGFGFDVEIDRVAAFYIVGLNRRNI